VFFSHLATGLVRVASPPWIDPVVRGLSDDSRLVRPGELFVARPGPRDDGARHVRDAIDRGAVAVIGPPGVAPGALAGDRVVAVGEAEVAAMPAVLGEVAARFFRRPSERLDLIGVTGTNGKTTVAFLTAQILSAAGRRTGLMGTVITDDGATRAPSSLTTPGAIELQDTLARMVSHGCTAASIEVSSHALDQGRVAGVRFRRAVFTNLTGDHLDYHGSMEAYAAAKRRLFLALDSSGLAIVNLGDPMAEFMVAGIAAPVLGFAAWGTGGATEAVAARSAVRARLGAMTPSGTEILLETPWGESTLRVPLVGRHNVENVLAAISVAGSLGVPFAAILAAVASAKAPPGRFEPVPVPGGRFTVLVDYAHTDDALRNALSALRPLLAPGSRLVAVFGCGGDRDRTKRPRMAAVAAELADEVVITSDNPRTEDPEAILDEIAAGLPKGRAGVRREVDRARAIELAIEHAREGDVVLIAGKGHEDYQIVGREKRDFDDRRVAAAAIARRGAGAMQEAVLA